MLNPPKSTENSKGNECLVHWWRRFRDEGRKPMGTELAASVPCDWRQMGYNVTVFAFQSVFYRGNGFLTSNTFKDGLKEKL